MAFIKGIILTIFYVVFSSDKCIVNSWMDLSDTGKLPKENECGRVDLSNRIMGGTETRIDEFPWTALIIYFNRSNGDIGSACAGTLINEFHVITAAQCVDYHMIFKNGINVTAVRLGEWNTATAKDCEKDSNGVEYCAPPPQDIKIDEVIINADFNRKQMLHDIALLRLVRKVIYSDFVSPICLPTWESQIYLGFSDATAEIAGWGETAKETYSNVKLKATVNIIPLQDCTGNITLDNVGFGHTYDPYRQSCAVGDGKIACKIDTGGPLMIMDKPDDSDRTAYYLIGIFSSVELSCTERKPPAIYTRIRLYMDWIRGILER
ncbi:serine protease easter [Zeugodacus cucurbitae]|uniref:Serine protease easter n=1 Tax=Zeugodacus cucurbitae TaxID=28588 RepID=A0A0A1XR41_ZEUCU|nr:serine protease easter [Zeugodacus cucurbitae]